MTNYQLEPTAAEMQQLIEASAKVVIDFLANIQDEPASNLNEHTVAHREIFREPLPERGASLDELLLIVRKQLIDCAVNTAGATYQAYIPGGGVYSSAVGEFIAAAINRYINVWSVAPCASELEATVIRWFADLIGYGSTARGILTSGGSLANFSAIIAARRALLPENFLNGIIYTSAQVHHSVTKSAMLAGFPVRNVRMIDADQNYRIDIARLSEAINSDRVQGLTPFLIVGNAGTTNTGAVDPIAELAALAQREKLWLHIDAAYGGFFLLTERGKQLFRGIEQADSVTLDPHKGLFLPYGTGCLVVRDGEALRRAHQVEAIYLQDLADSDEQINFTDYSPELTRSFRGLRVWLPLKLYGAAAFRNYLDEKLDLANWACQQLRQIDNIEIIAEPQLSVVAFRYLPDRNLSLEQINQLNKELLAKIIATKKTFISSTTLNGMMVLRIAILAFRTHKEDVQKTLDVIRDGIKN